MVKNNLKLFRARINKQSMGSVKVGDRVQFTGRNGV